MSDTYLNRGDAPFNDCLWSAIDNAVVESARSQLSGRRLLAVEGPFGLGLKSVPGRDREWTGKTGNDIDVSVSTSLPLVLIRKTFRLGTRDIAAFENGCINIDLEDTVKASVACAKQEDEFVFSGAKGMFCGLLDAPGVKTQKMRKWSEVGNAVEDVIQAVNQLDSAGFRGPYSLALSPNLYNGLFKRYPQSSVLEMEHLKSLVTDGIFKSGNLPVGGVLTVRNRQFASIMLGQDLTTGFIGPVDGGYEFSISESFTMRIAMPEAFCILK